MMLLCIITFMYESVIVIIGALCVEVKGKIATKDRNDRTKIGCFE